MADELVIRPLQQQDTDEILTLLKDCLGEGSIPRTPEYWSWKHRQNPFGCSAGLIAEANGSIVGLRVFMRWTWTIAGEKIPAVRAVDTATHPNWRGRGVFSRLTLALVDQMKDENVTLIFNTPNQYSRPGYLKMGWKDLGRTSLWLRTRASLRLAKGLLRMTRGKSGLRREPLPRTRFRSVLDLLEVLRMEQFERLQTSNTGALHTPVDLRYLDWRYAKIPGFGYSTSWKWKDDGAAAIIFRESQCGDLVELRICQILLNSSPHSGRLARQLMGEVIEQSRPDYAVCMSTSNNEGKALLGAGFVPIPRSGPIFTVRELNVEPGLTNVSNRSAWQLCIGDLELF